MDFYIHPNKSEWSSCFRSLAESDGSQSTKISVQTVTANEPCKKFGTPHYMKVDIEGCDTIVAK